MFHRSKAAFVNGQSIFPKGGYFMKFNIGTKVNVLIIIALILVGGASLLLSISSLKKGGEFAIQGYSADMMGRFKV